MSNRLKEDAPANNVGSGNIAGLGVGPQGEPGINPLNKYKRKNMRDTLILRRKRPVQVGEMSMTDVATTAGNMIVAPTGSEIPKEFVDVSKEWVKQKIRQYVSRKKKKLSEATEMGKFAGHDTFIVPTDTFLKAREHRRKGKHWKTYIGLDENGINIRAYHRKHKGRKPIILQDVRTGAMHYASYGKRK